MQEIVNRVKALVQPLLEHKQVELVDLTCRYESGRMTVRFLVDTSEGITVETLSELNRTVGALLEEHELFSEPFLLEVNSPGLDRPLKTATDFERVIGKRVKVYTNSPVAAKTELVGKLSSASDRAISLELDNGQVVRVGLTLIDKAVQEIGI